MVKENCEVSKGLPLKSKEDFKERRGVASLIHIYEEEVIKEELEKSETIKEQSEEESKLVDKIFHP